MASTSTLDHFSSGFQTGYFGELHSLSSNDHFVYRSSEELDASTSGSNGSSQFKKRKISQNGDPSLSSVFSNLEAFLPILRSSGYFTEPSLKELASRELVDVGYCRRVRNFTVGRMGYGEVKFLGETDVRWLNLDHIVEFNRHEIVVYKNKFEKPATGQGLNKPAEVTLILQVGVPDREPTKFNKLVDRLKRITGKQGASFISFNGLSGEWRFLVHHFSRFGLDEDEEEEMVSNETVVQQTVGLSGMGRLQARPKEEEITTHDEEMAVNDPLVSPSEPVLSHSLPAHLGLDPMKMQETRMVMFPIGEDSEDIGDHFSHKKKSFRKESQTRGTHIAAGAGSDLQYLTRQVSPHAIRKAPSLPSSSLPKNQPMLEYNVGPSDTSSPGTILMAGQSKGVSSRVTKVTGFKLELKYKTPIGGHSDNVVDAALLMGRSFRVGWGPNGLLVHTGRPVGNVNPDEGLSSMIHVEKVAIDRAVRDEHRKVKEELVDLRFASPLKFHKSITHKTIDFDAGSFKLRLYKLACTRSELSEICRGYIRIIEQQLDVSGLSRSKRIILMHQVTIWELIKVLFSVREVIGNSGPVTSEDALDMVIDKKNESLDMDPVVYPFARRADFSYWLQESVCHRVQEEISCLNESNDLEHIYLLMTGRQLESAVELAAYKGDVRLACSLSQAGGSMVNRSDMAQQLDLWRINGLDFNFIDKDRLKLYELLAGNIQGALGDSKFDWKRFLGLLMWYQLPPDTSLPIIIQTYEQLLSVERAPYPVPVYIDEGPLDETTGLIIGDHCDLAYYLMLLHANEEKASAVVKTMFSAFSSTYDALDYHMIWHQRSVLEAVGAFSSNDLHVLDMSLISQLLCLGQCHWAIYVVLHMPHRDDFPYLQANLIREILFQYCEFWSTQEIQRQLIEDLGVPPAWMHEALAIYHQYYGDLCKALEHLLECSNWQRAHSIFITSVAPSLFSSLQHSEIWRIASSMEPHKSEIADWDLGAGVYFDFYILRSLLQEENTMSELDSLEKKNDSCKTFFHRLNESLSVLGGRLPVNARATYSEMAEELFTLLMSNGGESSAPATQMSCFDTVLSAPIPEDRRSCHLQEAVSVFTFWLSGAT